MNLDPHWLKERFKDDSDLQLRFDLIFADEEVTKVIIAELERRNEEHAKAD
jgi:hypothetical protein